MGSLEIEERSKGQTASTSMKHTWKWTSTGESPFMYMLVVELSSLAFPSMGWMKHIIEVAVAAMKALRSISLGRGYGEKADSW
jgi:hypothetical protein